MHANCHVDEQRKSKRYRVGGNAYALLKQPQYKELGKIVDISETGISFLCINQGDWDQEPFKIDIFVDQQKSGQTEQIVLKDIPLKPIRYCRDNDTAGERGTAMMIRCGVEFGRLSLEQQARLNLFVMQNGFAHA